jgi:chloride channel protein, CIC family
MNRPSVQMGWLHHYRHTTRSLHTSRVAWNAETKMLVLSALVGAAAGVVACAFYVSLEALQSVVLEGAAGYTPLAAAGEGLVRESLAVPFRPWLLCFLPAIGALVGGLLSYHFAPETSGGGADGIIAAYHREGSVRKRVAAIKALSSICCLGFGGSGGREGPIMQVGGALGSLVGRGMRLDNKAQRILLVAGMAAGVAAIFRTPLGAALLAVEVLHRDRFESEALVPSVVASVASYSIFISMFGESTLFAHAARYPFVPGHLPLYMVMASLLALAGIALLALFRAIERRLNAISLPEWARPALGGLLLGITAVPLLLLVGPLIGGAGRGIGVLGGGYGAAQLAINGSAWFASGWTAVQLLCFLSLLKIVATGFTVGSGGSAGAFGPFLSAGAMLGGAFGRAVELMLEDPRIDPGSFALVGMATFWGGLAHCPLAALVLVCELAGSYDLLVPLMLASAVAFVLFRNHSLYTAQRSEPAA